MLGARLGACDRFSSGIDIVLANETLLLAAIGIFSGCSCWLVKTVVYDGW